MKKLLLILFIIYFISLTGCSHSENKPIDRNMHQNQETTSKQETEEASNDGGDNQEIITESDGEKTGGKIIEPIYMDIESPDKTMRLIANESGLVLVSYEYELLQEIINKEQQIGQGFEPVWSPDSNKICITQYSEEFATFSIYDIKNNKLIPINKAEGLVKTEDLPDSSYDWYSMTSPIGWLDNERILFDVNHKQPLDSSNPPSYERGCREDVYVYSLKDNLFTNLTNSNDGEYYMLKKIDHERHVLIIDIFVRGNQNVEMKKKNEIELPF